MAELMILISEWPLPIFIFATIANVGLTHDPLKILAYRREWRFMMKMLLANFIVAPLLMYLLLQIWPLEPALAAGLVVFSMCAGAPAVAYVVPHHHGRQLNHPHPGDGGLAQRGYVVADQTRPVGNCRRLALVFEKPDMLAVRRTQIEAG